MEWPFFYLYACPTDTPLWIPIITDCVNWQSGLPENAVMSLNTGRGITNKDGDYWAGLLHQDVHLLQHDCDHRSSLVARAFAIVLFVCTHSSIVEHFVHGCVGFVYVLVCSLGRLLHHRLLAWHTYYSILSCSTRGCKDVSGTGDILFLIVPLFSGSSLNGTLGVGEKNFISVVCYRVWYIPLWYIPPSQKAQDICCL